MAWQSGAVQRLRGFPSPDGLLRTRLLHVARGYSLRETIVRAKLANWAHISDVALLKRLRWCRTCGATRARHIQILPIVKRLERSSSCLFTVGTPSTFDRIRIAQSVREGLPMVTADLLPAKYPATLIG